MMALGLLILRVLVGALFIGHGTQKLFGWFGGHGIDGTAGFMESVRYRDGRKAAVLAGVTETVSGALLVLGFLTPIAVAGIVGVMLNAIVAVHWPNGVWNANGGFELPARVHVGRLRPWLHRRRTDLDRRCARPRSARGLVRDRRPPAGRRRRRGRAVPAATRPSRGGGDPKRAGCRVSVGVGQRDAVGPAFPLPFSVPPLSDGW